MLRVDEWAHARPREVLGGRLLAARITSQLDYELGDTWSSPASCLGLWMSRSEPAHVATDDSTPPMTARI
jgi:hypothetical protein